MNIVSYQTFYSAIDTLCYAISKSNVKIDAIVPIMRSGMIPAYKIAEKLHLPILIGDTLHGGSRLGNINKQVRNILLIEDSFNTGQSMAKEYKRYSNIKGVENVYTASVIVSPLGTKQLDFWSLPVDQPRIFEWNMFHTMNTSKIMFDMDGVICINPRVYDNDGVSYQKEIKDIPSLFVPTYPVHSIVTNRIERWRPETEAWLEKKRVKYSKLIMQQYNTAVERRLNSDPGEYKAKHYADSDAVLFIESDVNQAKKIYDITKRPVYCVDSTSFLGI